VVPQPVKNEADILGIFKELLWAEDGTLRVAAVHQNAEWQHWIYWCQHRQLGFCRWGNRTASQVLDRRRRTLVRGCRGRQYQRQQTDLGASEHWSALGRGCQSCRSKCRQLLFPSNDVDGKPTGKLEAVDVWKSPYIHTKRCSKAWTVIQLNRRSKQYQKLIWPDRQSPNWPYL